jgi:hypothetical protein
MYNNIIFNENPINRFDFSGRIKWTNDDLEPGYIGEEIETDNGTKYIILCINPDNNNENEKDYYPIIIQPINGSIIVKHVNIDDKNINDFIPDKDMKKSGFLVHKGKDAQKNPIYLIETDTGNYIRYCEDIGNPISINGIVYNYTYINFLFKNLCKYITNKVNISRFTIRSPNLIMVNFKDIILYVGIKNLDKDLLFTTTNLNSKIKSIEYMTKWCNKIKIILDKLKPTNTS